MELTEKSVQMEEKSSPHTEGIDGKICSKTATNLFIPVCHFQAKHSCLNVDVVLHGIFLTHSVSLGDHLHAQSEEKAGMTLPKA